MFTAEQIANWLLTTHNSRMRTDDAAETMTQMKLHKLLYYAQGVFLAYTEGQSLFSDPIVAWQHGPVVRAIYDRYRGQKEINDELGQEQIDDYNAVTKNHDAYLVLNTIYEAYGDYSAATLRNKTHEERPWKNTAINETISNEVIQEYFAEEILA